MGYTCTPFRGYYDGDDGWNGTSYGHSFQDYAAAQGHEIYDVACPGSGPSAFTAALSSYTGEPGNNTYRLSDPFQTSSEVGDLCDIRTLSIKQLRAKVCLGRDVHRQPILRNTVLESWRRTACSLHSSRPAAQTLAYFAHPSWFRWSYHE